MEHITITGDAPGDYGGLAGDGGTVVALGNFDGVHIGHQALLAAARERRDILGGGVRALVWTFTRHTADELGTHGHVPCITTPEEKVGLFGGCGMDGVIFENFDNVRDMEPGEFVDEILVKRLKCRAAVYGFNFRFGRGGKADAAVLSGLLRQASVEPVVIPPVTVGGDVVSSTRIREFVMAGDMARARAFLGRPFSLTQPVVRGDGIGAGLGFPTVNQSIPPGRLIPGSGVYACRCFVDAKYRPAVANVGTRPTVGGSELRCETHIIGWDGDLYGESVRVEFIERLRPERRFASPGELAAQIRADAARVEELWRDLAARSGMKSSDDYSDVL